MQDRGRDAIHISRSNPNDVTIFAYSVREDWRKKLGEDAEKIRRHGHRCSHLVFMSTASFRPSERDEAVTFIQREFGWTLELFGVERLRILLATTHERIIAKHPQIFVPPFFPIVGGISSAFSQDYLIIDHKACDEALATWLASRLTLEGYRVWCRSTAPIAGASLHETIDVLLRQRAFRFLTILSPGAIADPDMAARRVTALAISTAGHRNLLIPIVAAPFDEGALDAKTRQLVSLHFDGGWQTGLDDLLKSLEVANCPRAEGGARIALRAFIPEDVISTTPEKLVSNRFPVLRVPEVIHRFTSEQNLDRDASVGFGLVWSFRQVDPTTFLSFHPPPEHLREKLKMKQAGGASWPYVSAIDGISTGTLVFELIRKALVVACIRRGLAFCKDRRLLYFQTGAVPGDRLYFMKPDGSRSHINTVGKRTFWRPGSSSEYRYSLAPDFWMERTPSGVLTVITRIRIRLTDLNGVLLKRRTAESRRKHLCEDWWNDDWLHRILAIMQFLGNGGDITIGELPSDTIIISTQPHEWTVPIGIDETALPRAVSSRQEVLAHALETDEDDDDQDEADDDA